jgi:hypothetical protein
MEKDDKEIENYVFFNLSSQEIYSLFSEWMIKMDAHRFWKSFYMQIEKTHSEYDTRGVTQKYTMIAVASKKIFTKEELIKHIKNMKLNTPHNNLKG